MGPLALPSGAWPDPVFGSRAGVAPCFAFAKPRGVEQALRRSGIDAHFDAVDELPKGEESVEGELPFLLDPDVQAQRGVAQAHAVRAFVDLLPAFSASARDAFLYGRGIDPEAPDSLPQGRGFFGGNPEILEDVQVTRGRRSRPIWSRGCPAKREPAGTRG